LDPGRVGLVSCVIGEALHKTFQAFSGIIFFLEVTSISICLVVEAQSAINNMVSRDAIYAIYGWNAGTRKTVK